MAEYAATLARFLGSQMSDQGLVMFHFESSEQRFIVALPPQEITRLIAGGINQLPLVMDERGKPVDAPITAIPTSWAAAFRQPNGSIVLGLSIPTGGQVAFVLSREAYENVTGSERPDQSDAGQGGAAHTPDEASHKAAKALLDAITRVLAVKFPFQSPDGAVGIAVAEILRAAGELDRDPFQDLQGVARVLGMQLASVPPGIRQQLADLLVQQFNGGMNWMTPPGPHGAN